MTDLESHAAQEARRTVDALTGNRPRFLGKRFEAAGEFLGAVPTGPRVEVRAYQLGDEIYVGFWKEDPRCPGRYVPQLPDIGFLHLAGDEAQALAKILATL